MPYEIVVRTESADEATRLRQEIARLRYRGGKDYETVAPRLAVEPPPTTVWTKMHRDTGAVYGRVFKMAPEALVVQRNETVETITRAHGSWFGAAFTPEQAAIMAFMFWWQGLTKDQRKAWERLLQSVQEPLRI